jgi:hypothetical protein
VNWNWRVVIIVGAAVALLVIGVAAWGWEAIQPPPEVVTPPAPSTVTPPAPSTIVLNYDTEDTSQFNLTQLVNTWSLTFDAGRTRRGSGFSGRFEVRAGDNPLSPTEMTERAEVGYTSFDEGDDIWLGWSTWFDSRLLNPTDTAATDVTNTFTQFHEGAPNVSIPPISMSIDTNNYAGPGYHMICRVSGGAVNSANQPATPPTRIDLGEIIYDKWVDFLIHVKFSSNPTVGKFEVFVNGVSKSGLLTLATMYPGRNNYFKQGYYRTPQAGTSVIWHDQTKIGATRASVTP